MSPSFSGNFILDVFILTFVLILPIPTTPFLVYLFINMPIIEFMILYLIASNLYISTIYFSGSFLHQLKIQKFLNKINISSDGSRIIKLKNWRDKAYDFAINKLRNISIWNIIVIRTVGVHATIVAFGSGMINAKYFNNIIANSFLAIIDVVFYWILLGSGKLIFEKLFPEIDIDYYLTEYFFQTITISLIIFYVVFFLIKLFQYKSKNKR